MIGHYFPKTYQRFIEDEMSIAYTFKFEHNRETQTKPLPSLEDVREKAQSYTDLINKAQKDLPSDSDTSNEDDLDDDNLDDSDEDNLDDDNLDDSDDDNLDDSDEDNLDENTSDNDDPDCFEEHEEEDMPPLVSDESNQELCVECQQRQNELQQILDKYYEEMMIALDKGDKKEVGTIAKACLQILDLMSYKD
jgi:hypothetical protein